MDKIPIPKFQFGIPDTSLKIILRLLLVSQVLPMTDWNFLKALGKTFMAKSRGSRE